MHSGRRPVHALQYVGPVPVRQPKENIFVVAPNYIATKTNGGESAFAAAVGSLRFHGRALFAPHAPLHNVGTHAKLCGG